MNDAGRGQKYAAYVVEITYRQSLCIRDPEIVHL